MSGERKDLSFSSITRGFSPVLNGKQTFYDKSLESELKLIVSLKLVSKWGAKPVGNKRTVECKKMLRK
mgnify:CR=1 FL=1